MMKKLIYLLLIMVPYLVNAQGDSIKVSELPAASAPDANDLLFFIEDGASTNITKSLLQKSLRDSLITVMLEVDHAYDSIAAHLAQLQDLDDAIRDANDSLSSHLSTLQDLDASVLDLNDSIATIWTRYYGVMKLYIDSLGFQNDTFYVRYDGDTVKWPVMQYQGGTPIEFCDNFNDYINGTTLAGQGYWEQEINDVKIYNAGSDGEVYGGTSGDVSIAYYSRPVYSNHCVTVTTTSLGSGYLSGPAVRCQGGTGYGYFWYSGGSGSYLFREDNGTHTQLGSGAPWTEGDEIMLCASGDSLFLYKNGSLDTSIDYDGIYVDNSGGKLSGGYGGVATYGNQTISRIDDWCVIGTSPGGGGGGTIWDDSIDVFWDDNFDTWDEDSILTEAEFQDYWPSAMLVSDLDDVAEEVAIRLFDGSMTLRSFYEQDHCCIEWQDTGSPQTGTGLHVEIPLGIDEEYVILSYNIWFEDGWRLNNGFGIKNPGMRTKNDYSATYPFARLMISDVTATTPDRLRMVKRYGYNANGSQISDNGGYNLDTIITGEWHHIDHVLYTGTLNGSNGWWDVYYDGVKVQSTDVSGNPQTSTKSSLPFKITGTNYNWNTVSIETFAGGNTSDWESPRDQYMWLDDIVVWFPKNYATFPMGEQWPSEANWPR